MTSQDIATKIPLLRDIRVSTAPMPLWYSHWRGLTTNAFIIRQDIATPFENGGLDFSLCQHETVRRGVETIWGKVPTTTLLLNEKAGAEEWLQAICNKINLGIKGSKPIEHLQLARTTKPRFLAYYAPFYANYMELVLYIDDCAHIDGATVTHLPRSRVDESTRDWKRLAEQLPIDVWIEAKEA